VLDDAEAAEHVELGGAVSLAFALETDALAPLTAAGFLPRSACLAERATLAWRGTGCYADAMDTFERVGVQTLWLAVGGLVVLSCGGEVAKDVLASSGGTVSIDAGEATPRTDQWDDAGVSGQAGDAGVSGQCAVAPGDAGGDVPCTETCAGACSAGGCMVTLATEATPYVVLVDAENVYWTDAAGTIVKEAKAGGTPTTIYSQWGESLQNVAVDGDAIYWTNEQPGSIMKLSVSGGAATTLTTTSPAAGTLTSLAAFGGMVFWTNSNSVMSVPESGSAVATVATGMDSPTGVMADDTYAYWASGVASTGKIMRALRGGGAVTTLAKGQDDPLGIALDASYVYWTALGSTRTATGTIVKQPIAGGTPTTLATGQGFPWGIAVSATGVYWANSLTGTVMRSPPCGGAPETLASGQTAALNIAADASGVYWTTESTVMGLKPSCACR
jgi:hypothetical protein